jgi:hypothetical protein
MVLKNKEKMKNKVFLILSLGMLLLLVACSTAHHCNCG